MSWISKLFGGNQKRDTSYGGAEPVTSLSKVQGGQPYYEAISNRLKGQDVGFGGQYADKYSSPIIARMRNQFTGYQLPELTSELSATGRRKGSAGFDQMRRAYQEQGLNEGEVFSNLQQRNEDQQRNEINDALARMGDFAKGEANLISQKAAFDVGQHQNQLAEADKQAAAGNAAFQRLIGLGTSFIPYSAPTAAMTKPAFSQTDYGSNMFTPWGQGGSMNDRIARRLGQQGGVNPYQTRTK